MRPPSARLALAASPRAQFWVLWGFFFFAETASYLLGVLSSTLLVKRAGAERLPEAYLLLNAVFLPVVLMVLARPPRSSFRAVRASMAVYLLATLATLPGADSTSVPVLMAMYVVARLGKLIWSTFAVGMVAEILPLRDAKKATPSLLAAASAGIVLAGVVLKWTLAAVGIRTAFVALWAMLGGAYAMLLLLEPGVAPREPAGEEAPRPSLGATLTGLLSVPLARVIGLQNLFVVGMRYFVEFVYAGALGRQFATERDMAGFAGVFEATLQVSTAAVQFALTGPLMRTLGVGGVALLMPSILIAATGAAALWDSFAVILLCQFLFWVASDGCNKPARQVMVGALPRSHAASVPVLMAALGMSGSLAASTLLVPLARAGSPSMVMAFTCALAVGFLLLSTAVGRTYRTTLWSTLQGLDERQRTEVIGGYGQEEAGARHEAVSAMLESPEAEIRFQATREALDLSSEEAGALLMRHLTSETDSKVRAAMLSSLAELGPPGLDPVLERALADSDPRVRATALEALSVRRATGAVLPAIESALASDDARERAAAVLAAVRGSSDAALLGRALDSLARLLESAETPRDRASGVFALGQLGYPFLLPAMEEALADREPAVRRSAVEALLASHAAVALPLIAEALARETDPELAARMAQVTEGLRDQNVRAVLDLSGHLTGAERCQIADLLSRTPGDRKLALLSDAVLIGRREIRSALVELVHTTRDAGLLDALHRCLRPAGEERVLSLEPLLSYLAAAEGPAAQAGYDALHALLAGRDDAAVRRHLAVAIRSLWERARQAGGGIVRGPELDHVLAIAAASTRRPERAVEAMRAVTSGDRYRASLSVELMEQWLTAPVAALVLPLLEAAMEPVLSEAAIGAALDALARQEAAEDQHAPA
ncbi:MAG: HEAT repeat domain-containing protein [Candidatus Wallbacteria bacterium]|nr:HEAT repeat domain-containing protein [Candidatus Wallbacteria bacterium]